MDLLAADTDLVKAKTPMLLGVPVGNSWQDRTCPACSREGIAQEASRLYTLSPQNLPVLQGEVRSLVTELLDRDPSQSVPVNRRITWPGGRFRAQRWGVVEVSRAYPIGRHTVSYPDQLPHDDGGAKDAELGLMPHGRIVFLSGLYEPRVYTMEPDEVPSLRDDDRIGNEYWSSPKFLLMLRDRLKHELSDPVRSPSDTRPREATRPSAGRAVTAREGLKLTKLGGDLYRLERVYGADSDNKKLRRVREEIERLQGF